MDQRGMRMSNVLWWGRSDPGYSRNRIVRKLFDELGWEVSCFHPFASQTGGIEAVFHRLKRPDLIWVPCFRHRDIHSAAIWAQKWRVPLIIDPLISAYEKEVFEKSKWSPQSKQAEKKRLAEAALFAKADVVVADTPAHADFFKQRLHVRPEKLCVLFVGAETDIFKPVPLPVIQPPFEILFYGSFLQLQGPDIIVKAARKTQDMAAKWILLGDGDLRKKVEGEARALSNVVFEPWIQYDRLPERVASAHVLLGVFGTTLKADLVIPNKMFQAMAAGRPVVSRIAGAYPEPLRHSNVIGWVPPGDPEALGTVVRQWLKAPEALAARGQNTRQLFDTFFNEKVLKKQLRAVLDKAKH